MRDKESEIRGRNENARKAESVNEENGIME